MNLLYVLLVSLARLIQPAQVGLDLQREATYRERLLVVREQYRAADIERKAQAQALLRSIGGGVPAAYQPSFATLARLRRLLSDEPSVEVAHAAHQAWMDALDCRLVPGLLEADAREATAITVFCSALYDTSLPKEELEFCLRWRMPGGAELSARREGIAMDDLRGRPFEMYVHAPPGVNGTWLLVPSLILGEHEVRGWPVPIEAVPHLKARWEVSQGDARQRLEALLQSGLRDSGAPAAELLLSGAAVTGASCTLAEEVLATGRVVRLSPVDSPAEWIVVLPTLQCESVSSFSGGRVASPWPSFVARERALVVISDLPLVHPQDPSLQQVLDALRLREASLPIVLVVRGPRLSELALALRKGARFSVNACVQSTLLAPGSSPNLLLAVPTLFVEMLARQEDRLGQTRGELLHLALTDPPFAGDLCLPELLGTWWRGRR